MIVCMNVFAVECVHCICEREADWGIEGGERRSSGFMDRVQLGQRSESLLFLPLIPWREALERQIVMTHTKNYSVSSGFLKLLVTEIIKPSVSIRTTTQLLPRSACLLLFPSVAHAASFLSSSHTCSFPFCKCWVIIPQKSHKLQFVFLLYKFFFPLAPNNCCPQFHITLFVLYLFHFVFVCVLKAKWNQMVHWDNPAMWEYSVKVLLSSILPLHKLLLGTVELVNLKKKTIKMAFYRRKWLCYYATLKKKKDV